MADLLGTGVSGLMAYQRALATTSNNISNVNTPGYSRQRTELTTNQPQFTGGTYIGSGVQVANVSRVFDQFLTDQVRSASSAMNQSQTTHDLAVQVDNMLADAKSGVAPTIQNFFGAVQDLSSDPTSTPARQVVLSQAQTVAARFQDLYSRLDGMRAGVNTQLSDVVQQVNSLATSIAQVNKNILNSPKGSGNQLPSDLLDQRDQLVNELSQYTSVRTAPQSDGTLNVFIGSGQSMVVGTKAQQLSTVKDPYDPTRLQVAYVDSSGGSVDVTRQLSGGKIAGLVDFRDNILDPAISGLGRVAIGLAQSFNDQHKLGQDLNGKLGGDFFSVGAPQVTPNSGNSGTATVNASISNIADLTNSNYTLQRNGSSYTLTRQSDGTVTDIGAMGFPGSAVTVDGVSLSLGSGAIASGDKFLIRPTYNGARDIGVKITQTNAIAAAAPIRTSAASTNTGDTTISTGTVNGPPPTNVNLQQPVTITFNSPPTTFSVSGTGTGGPASVAYTSGGDISYNGWTLQISGTPAAGDTFTVQSNTSGAGDNRNSLLLAGVQSKTVMDQGASSVVDVYGSVVANVGTQTKQAELTTSAQTALLQQSTSTRDSVSGVNLDEEAANLVRFQQAYQASARVITVANTLFNAVLSAMG